MNRLLYFAASAALLIFATVSFRPLADEMKTLSIGEKAPLADHQMMSTQGKNLSLESMVGKVGLLVVFSCNTCPFVVGAEGYGEGWNDRYNTLCDAATSKGIGMILVNANEGKRPGDDSMDKMKEQAQKSEYQMPYVLDKDSRLADAFGARTTPHVFLFDANMTLVYKGAIDDNNESRKEVKETWLMDAMNELAKGENITKPETRNIGCSIKRVKK